MQIPTLFLRSDQPALFCLDGAALGEAGPDQPISLPIAPDGLYYVNAQPLVENYVGMTRRLIFEGGELQEAPESTSVQIWPGGMHELCFRLPPLPQHQNYQPAMSLAVKQFGNITATLFQEQGIHIAIDRGDEMVFSHTIAPDGKAHMELLQANNARLLYIVAKSEDGMHCVCLRIDQEIEICYEDHGDYFTRDGINVMKQVALKSRRGYEKREIYNAASGRLEERKIGFFSREANPVLSAQDACMDLMDALRFGLEAQCCRLLAGTLSDLSYEDLKEFFGDFDICAFAPGAVSDGILIGLGTKQALTKMRLYRFDATAEDGEYWRVVNVTEL